MGIILIPLLFILAQPLGCRPGLNLQYIVFRRHLGYKKGLEAMGFEP